MSSQVSVQKVEAEPNGRPGCFRLVLDMREGVMEELVLDWAAWRKALQQELHIAI